MPPPIGVGQGDGVTLGAIVGSGVWLGIKLGVAELATINGSVAVAVGRGTVGVGVDVIVGVRVPVGVGVIVGSGVFLLMWPDEFIVLTVFGSAYPVGVRHARRRIITVKTAKIAA